MKMRKRWLWLLTALVIPVGYAGVAITGSLEPTSAPGTSTMRTLEELQPSWSKKITEASKRFETVLDGAAVLDKETGLVWEKSPDTTKRNWGDAINYAYNKTVGGRGGWRLPTVEELRSLVDPTQSSPALPSGYSSFFSNVQSDWYWSVTTDVNPYATFYAWSVSFHNGGMGSFSKGPASIYASSCVWCVRGGHADAHPY